jgi:hypothetical protein
MLLVYKVLTWVLIMNLLQKFIGVEAFDFLEEKINFELGISFFLSKELLLEFMSPWLCTILPLGFLGRET